MKVLRIIGIVAAIHAFAFVLIMANPGCSTKPKSQPAVADQGSVASEESSPVSAAPAESPAPSASPISSAPFAPNENPIPVTFDPEAAAVSVPRYSPTRPGTPASAALQAEPAADVIPATTVIVGRGDSLWLIAKKHHIPVSDLAAANNLSTGSTLQVGQKLIVPAKATGAGTTTLRVKSEPAKAAAPRASSSGDSFRHVVKPGESLALIARKYGVRQGTIAEANSITNPALVRAGQELIIPGWQAPKASKPAAARETQPVPAPTPAQVMPSVNTEPSPSRSPVMPVIGAPSADQDLDAGLPQKEAAPVPVIKIEETPAP